ncbi:DUF2062 domain-containing protein [Arhodomonas sp. SL1]|uniref:DUF2062 domain-containing protein n=1 Tax=Arhodomonas sp. SL1 TaxID=3425691 RepID=UPI003F8833B7
MFEKAAVRFRALKWRGHVWLRRHPAINRALHTTGCLTHGTEAAARGVAVGLFLGLTPTVGFQTVLMIAGCMLLRGNFPAAFAISWVSNPFTMGPLYWGFHAIGEALLNAVPWTPVNARQWALDGIGEEVVFAVVGSLLVATPVALAGYLITHRLAAWLAARRAQRRRTRQG